MSGGLTLQLTNGNQNKYNCWGCGACCKSLSDETLTLVGLPKSDIGPGCGNLNPDNTCKIYQSRPIFCQVDKMYELVYEKMGITWDQYSKETEEECKRLEKKYLTSKDV